MDRDVVVETAVAVAGVAALAAAVVLIGAAYASSGGTLDERGGQALVAAIAGFIVVMSVVGVALSRRH